MSKLAHKFMSILAKLTVLYYYSNFAIPSEIISTNTTVCIMLCILAQGTRSITFWIILHNLQQLIKLSTT